MPIAIPTTMYADQTIEVSHNTEKSEYLRIKTQK